jgi:replication-associated recombination protein RarA
MTFAELITPGGYKIGEVASAMQKCIRRGLADDALFWATELDLTRTGPDCTGFGEYVWKRLKIIASEDVGPADHTAAPTITALYQHWLEQRKKKDTRHAPERLFLVHAVLFLAGCRKSRTVDHALITMYEAPRGARKIPDFALDRHTAAGRKLRRGWKHFWEQGARLAAPPTAADWKKTCDTYERIARATRHDKQASFDFHDL